MSNSLRKLKAVSLTTLFLSLYLFFFKERRQLNRASIFTHVSLASLHLADSLHQ